MSNLKRNRKLSLMAKKVSKQSQYLNVYTSDAQASKFVLLKWNHTIQPDREMFANILLAAKPADVTLECPDGTVKSYKVILESCSGFFRDTFQRNQSDEPHVMLRGFIKLKELYIMLHFIYFGYVYVRQYEIHIFLNAAKFLQIDGMNFPDDSSNYLYTPTISLQEVKRNEYLDNTSAERGAIYGTPCPNEYWNNQWEPSKSMVVTSPYNEGCTVYDNSVKAIIPNSTNNQNNKMSEVSSPYHASKGMNLDASSSPYFTNQWSTNTTVKPPSAEPYIIKGVEHNLGAFQSTHLPNITKYNDRIVNSLPMADRNSQNVPLNSSYNTTPFNTQNMSQADRPACSMGQITNAKSSSTLKATSAPPISSHLWSRYQPYTKPTISSTFTNRYSPGVATTMNKTNSDDIYGEKYKVDSVEVLPYSSNDAPGLPQSVNQVKASNYSCQGQGHCTSANLDVMSLNSSRDVLLPHSPTTDEDEISDVTNLRTLRGIWNCELFPENNVKKFI